MNFKFTYWITIQIRIKSFHPNRYLQSSGRSSADIMLQLKVLGGSDVSDPSKITYHSPTEVPASSTRLNVLN